MKNKTAFGSVGVVTTVLALLALPALTACQDEELKEACSDVCAQRIACDKEEGTGTTSQGNCETACLLQGDAIVDKSNECSGKEACEYTACIDG
jgi:hypothetical protein